MSKFSKLKRVFWEIHPILYYVWYDESGGVVHVTSDRGAHDACTLFRGYSRVRLDTYNNNRIIQTYGGWVGNSSSCRGNRRLWLRWPTSFT